MAFSPLSPQLSQISPLEDCYVESLSLKESDQHYYNSSINNKLQNEDQLDVQNGDQSQILVQNGDQLVQNGDQLVQNEDQLVQNGDKVSHHFLFL